MESPQGSRQRRRRGHLKLDKIGRGRRIERISSIAIGSFICIGWFIYIYWPGQQDDHCKGRKEGSVRWSHIFESIVGCQKTDSHWKVYNAARSARRARIFSTYACGILGSDQEMPKNHQCVILADNCHRKKYRFKSDKIQPKALALSEDCALNIGQ